MRSNLGRFHRPMSRGLVNNMLTMNNLGDGSTLSLDFTTMGGVLDPRLTFTRASTVATYVNSSGYVATATTNEPRFDYSPTTVGSPNGLLIEGSAINKIYGSESLAASGLPNNWGFSDQVTRNSTLVTSPRGTDDAVTVNETIANNIHRCNVYVTPGYTVGNICTVSCWVKVAKSATPRKFLLNAVGLLNSSGLFDLTASGNSGTAQATGGAGANRATAWVKYPNNWYRVSVTGNFVADSNLYLQINRASSSTAADDSFIGETDNGVIIWGVQLELGSGASSYIVTGASQVTRTAEECRMTGTNFSSWFAGATEGVFFAEYEKPRNLGSQDYVALSTVYAAGALLNITTNTGTLWPSSICWPTGGALFPGGITTACPAVTKRAIRWFNDNDFSNFADGVLGTTSNGTGTLTMTMLNVGATTNTGTSSTADWLNSCIKKIKFYPIALPNAYIQTLTAP